jgi:hypothetical protein
MKNLLINFLTILFLLSIGLVSCKKENSEPAPQLPPESSFVMDFSGFANANDTLNSREIASYQNWGHSFVSVTVWNAIITVGLAVPVAAFYESFNHQAVYHPDENNWTWSYNFKAGGVWHEAELTGFFISDTVNWEMRITKDGFYSDFLWYTGKNSFDRSGGYWILNENPDNPNELLQIDWTYEGGGIGDISYTNIKPGSPENGGYINYGTMAGDLTRFYDIFNKGQDNLTEIEWNHNDNHGRVADPGKFGDTNWHCWDVTLQDVICP